MGGNCLLDQSEWRNWTREREHASFFRFRPPPLEWGVSISSTHTLPPAVRFYVHAQLSTPTHCGQSASIPSNHSLHVTL